MNNDSHQHLCTQGEFQLLPASLGGFLMSASESELSSFQITVSVLGPGACEILCALFKTGVYFSQPSGSPKSKLY